MHNVMLKLLDAQAQVQHNMHHMHVDWHLAEESDAGPDLRDRPCRRPIPIGRAEMVPCTYWCGIGSV